MDLDLSERSGGISRSVGVVRVSQSGTGLALYSKLSYL